MYNASLFASSLDSPVTCPPHVMLRERNLLPVRRIGPGNCRKLRLPLVSIRQQLLLVVEQLLPRLGGILGVRALHNGVHGTRLLAEAAVDALGHVDIVSCRPARSILTLLGFNGDGLGRADGFAQFAGDAALFASGVAAQGVLTTEPGRDRALFEWVVDCVSVVLLSAGVAMKMLDRSDWDLRWPEELLKHDIHAPHHLGEQEVVTSAIPGARFALVPALGLRQAEVLWWWSLGRGGAEGGGGEGSDGGRHCSWTGEQRGGGPCARERHEGPWAGHCVLWNG